MFYMSVIERLIVAFVLAALIALISTWATRV